ncbi:Serine/threonine-protein kinase TAO1 [Blomia tropicalis]|nr:Serine/threonine-protein kinase TAO1 [Blomia tropicalis]
MNEYSNQHSNANMKIDEQVNLDHDESGDVVDGCLTDVDQLISTMNRQTLNHSNDNNVNNVKSSAILNGNSHQKITGSIHSPTSCINGETIDSDLRLSSKEIANGSLTLSKESTTEIIDDDDGGGLVSNHNDSKLSNGSLPDELSTSIKAKPIVADGVCLQKTPFPLLVGEELHYEEKLVNGVIYLTNYRLYVKPSSKLEESHANYQLQQQEQPLSLAIGVIDSIEIRELVYLVVFTKYVQSFIITFQTSESALIWQKRLNESQNIKMEDMFCFRFFSKLSSANQPLDDNLENLLKCHRNEMNRYSDFLNMLSDEFKRMKFGKNWKICELNKDFKFCNSYPQYFIVPNDTTDKELECVANFRYSRRIPVTVWRSTKNGCIIARSSQPIVGWLGWRSSQDERLLQKIMNLCNRDTQECSSQSKVESNGFRHSLPNGLSTTTINHNDSNTNELHVVNKGLNELNGHAASNGSLATNHSMEKLNEDGTGKFLILDARSYTAAIANRAMGGGCECPEYYANCDVQFMSLNNIHSIRKSFHSLRFICEAGQIDQTNWFTMLDNTKWFHNLAALLKASMVVVDAISIQERPVLVHCSDGWDRTPQVVALAELILDPYYRTIDGFKVLIEREWLQFGHKFTDRCRSTTLSIDLNERCPVFLQWLDCVHQLLRQFPNEFEFNVYLLIKLVYHTYAGLFGTFAYNNVQERISHSVRERTISFWSYLTLEKANFINYLYYPEQEVLKPSSRVKDMHFWNEVYVPLSGTSVINVIPKDEISIPKGARNNQARIFVSRTSNDIDISPFNEANIDESGIEFNCDHSIKCQSQSKCDLHRSASYDSLIGNKAKSDYTGNLSQQNGFSSDTDCKLRIRHLSDSCLLDGNEMSNDRDNFLRSSFQADESNCDIEQKCTNDYLANSLNVNEDTNRDESFVSPVGIVDPSCDLFEDASYPLPLANNPNIDGQIIVKDKSHLQLQQIIYSYEKQINALCSQLNSTRKAASHRSRTGKPHQLEESTNSRKHSAVNGDIYTKQHWETFEQPNCDTVNIYPANGKKVSDDVRSMQVHRARSMTEDRTQQQQ